MEQTSIVVESLANKSMTVRGKSSRGKQTKQWESNYLSWLIVNRLVIHSGIE